MALSASDQKAYHWNGLSRKSKVTSLLNDHGLPNESRQEGGYSSFNFKTICVTDVWKLKKIINTTRLFVKKFQNPLQIWKSWSNRLMINNIV